MLRPRMAGKAGLTACHTRSHKQCDFSSPPQAPGGRVRALGSPQERRPAVAGVSRQNDPIVLTFGIAGDTVLGATGVLTG